MDETSVSLHFPLRHCWMRRGQQTRLPAASLAQRESQALIGAYNWGRNTIFAEAVERSYTATFLAFLEHLLTEVYPTEAVVLVMDNASYHHAAAVQAALAVVEHRVRVVFLPPYCSQLNAIERFWRHLKDTVWANRLFHDLPSLTSALRHLLDCQNQPGHPLRFRLSN